MKLAIIQRLCPSWRLPLFQDIASRPSLDLTVFYGRGSATGASTNASRISGFAHHQLATWQVPSAFIGRDRYRVVHLGLPWQLLRERFDIVALEGSTNLADDLLAWPALLASGTRVIWMEYGAAENMSLARRAVDPLVRRLSRDATGCIAFFDLAERQLLANGVEARRIFRVLNTMDTAGQRSALQSRCNELPVMADRLSLRDTFVVGYVGGIERRKRLMNLIAAVGDMARRGVSVALVVVGDGADREQFEAEAESMLPGLVRWVGRQNADTILYLGLCDVVVLPGEGGQAVPHAFAAGKPVVATREAWVGGDSVFEYLTDGVEGFVVDCDSVRALASALTMLAGNQELLRRMSEAASRRGAELTLRRMADQFVAAVRSTMELPPRRNR